MFVSKEVKDKMAAENQAAYDALKSKEIQDRRRRVFEQVALAIVVADWELATNHRHSFLHEVNSLAETILSEADIFASKVQEK